MSEHEYIDPARRSQKELILKLLDKMEELEGKVEKYIESDIKEVRLDIQKIKINQAVLQAKAALIGGVIAVVVSIISQFIK